MGNNNVMSFCWMQNVKIGNGVKVEPYSKISNTELEDNKHIKSFTEIEGE